MKLKIKDRSTISSKEYVVEHVYWYLICYLSFKGLFFIPVCGMSVSRSKLLLTIIAISVFLLSCFVRWNRCMTTRSVISDIIIIYGIYIFAAYKKYYSNWFKIIVILFCAGILIIFIKSFLKKCKEQYIIEIKNRNKRNVILRSRLIRCLDLSGLYLSFLMVIMLIPIGYVRIVHNGIMVADVDKVAKGFDIGYTENEYGLERNIDLISKIRTDESWGALNIEEKLAVLQVICNCEKNYFGLDTNITVVIDDLDGNTVGAYNDSERLVIIDSQYIQEANAVDVLDTCLHEMYHAWEHSLVRLYLDSDVEQRKLRVFIHCEQYIDEIMKYEDGGSDYESFMKYYGQYMEQDSRAYAREAVEEYYREIDTILRAN